MDAIVLGLIGAMVLGVVIIAVSLGRKSRRPTAPASKPTRSRVPFSPMDSTSHSLDPPVYLSPRSDDDSAERLAGAAVSLAERVADAVEESREQSYHRHEPHAPQESLRASPGHHDATPHADSSGDAHSHGHSHTDTSSSDSGSSSSYDSGSSSPPSDSGSSVSGSSSSSGSD